VNGDVLIKYEYVADGFDASFIGQHVLADSDPNIMLHKDDLGDIWMVQHHPLQTKIVMSSVVCSL
jgi:hypothetical protein